MPINLAQRCRQQVKFINLVLPQNRLVAVNSARSGVAIGAKWDRHKIILPLPHADAFADVVYLYAVRLAYCTRKFRDTPHVPTTGAHAASAGMSLTETRTPGVVS